MTQNVSSIPAWVRAVRIVCVVVLVCCGLVWVFYLIPQWLGRL